MVSSPGLPGRVKAIIVICAPGPKLYLASGRVSCVPCAPCSLLSSHSSLAPLFAACRRMFACTASSEVPRSAGLKDRRPTGTNESFGYLRTFASQRRCSSALEPPAHSSSGLKGYSHWSAAGYEFSPSPTSSSSLHP